MASNWFPDIGFGRYAFSLKYFLTTQSCHPALQCCGGEYITRPCKRLLENTKPTHSQCLTWAIIIMGKQTYFTHVKPVCWRPDVIVIAFKEKKHISLCDGSRLVTLHCTRIAHSIPAQRHCLFIFTPYSLTCQEIEASFLNALLSRFIFIISLFIIPRSYWGSRFQTVNQGQLFYSHICCVWAHNFIEHWKIDWTRNWSKEESLDDETTSRL